jgi:hypothetical protein
MRYRNFKATSKTCVWKTSRKDFNENDGGVEMTSPFVPIAVLILCLIFAWWAGNQLEKKEKAKHDL